MDCSECGQQSGFCKRCDERRRLFPYTKEQVNDPSHVEYVEQKIQGEISISSLSYLMKMSMETNDEETYWRTYFVYSRLLLSSIDQWARDGEIKWHPEEENVLGIR